MTFDEKDITAKKVRDFRNMTVGQLKKALEQYPDDRKVHVSVFTGSYERGKHFEIKEVSFLVEMDKNITHPVLNIGDIKFE